MIKTCSVFGHSEITITKELEEKLTANFKKLIEDGCENFYFGGFGMFDDLCHKIITELNLVMPTLKEFFAYLTLAI